MELIALTVGQTLHSKHYQENKQNVYYVQISMPVVLVVMMSLLEDHQQTVTPVLQIIHCSLMGVYKDVKHVQTLVQLVQLVLQMVMETLLAQLVLDFLPYKLLIQLLSVFCVQIFILPVLVVLMKLVRGPWLHVAVALPMLPCKLILLGIIYKNVFIVLKSLLSVLVVQIIPVVMLLVMVVQAVLL